MLRLVPVVVPIALGALACASTRPAPPSPPIATAPASGPRPAPPTRGRPEDVFAQKIVITREPLPLHFSSASAFTAAIEKEKVLGVWPRSPTAKEGAWVLPYVAFFAEPLTERGVLVSLHDGPRLVASDSQFTREVGSRIFSSEISLSKPEFEPFKSYRMTISVGEKELASTEFWLLGVAAGYALHVGSFEGAADAVAGTVVRETLEAELRQRWPAASSGPSTARGILVDGSITKLAETQTPDGLEVSCEIRVLIGRWPERRVMMWVQTGATVLVGPSAKTAAEARRDCLDASVHQVVDALGPLYGAPTK